MKTEETDRLIALIETGDWDTALNASDKLSEYSDDRTVRKLIGLLGSSRTETRNAAALALREIGNDIAVEPLLEAIRKPENRTNRSTMIYALEKLDCSNHFIDIFMLALAPKEDVRLSALNILHEQGFWLSGEEIGKARFLLKSHNKECPNDSVIEILGELLNSLEE